MVVDTAFYGPNTPTQGHVDPAGELDGYVSYLVYVNMTNPTDVLVQSCHVALPQGGAWGIEAECGTGILWTSLGFGWQQQQPFLGDWPRQYDTFWTI